MDAVQIINNANLRMDVGDLTRKQYENLIAPLRDVELVRHGRWISCHPLGDNTPEGYICSACRVGGWEQTNFCPNCGAKMDGKDGYDD